MDGGCRISGEIAEHFGCASGRSHQHDRQHHLAQRLDECSGERCLPGACVAVEEEYGVGPSVVGRGAKTSQRRDEADLLLVRIVRKIEKYPFGKFVGIHFFNIADTNIILFVITLRNSNHKQKNRNEYR